MKASILAGLAALVTGVVVNVNAPKGYVGTQYPGIPKFKHGSLEVLYSCNVPYSEDIEKRLHEENKSTPSLFRFGLIRNENRITGVYGIVDKVLLPRMDPGEYWLMPETAEEIITGDRSKIDSIIAHTQFVY